MWRKSLDELHGTRDRLQIHNQNKNYKMLALNRSYQPSTSTTDDNNKNENFEVNYIYICELASFLLSLLKSLMVFYAN